MRKPGKGFYRDSGCTALSVCKFLLGRMTSGKREMLIECV
ncbi:hypothetical protein HMPREF3038_02537 [Akkermansia sp. KLE1797]|nr:hypothetical protein HMPREF3038_02537 [Akkermansia sp. KLE1797]